MKPLIPPRLMPPQIEPAARGYTDGGPRPDARRRARARAAKQARKRQRG